ncbi:MAG TPA: histidine--tRNA ligase [Candidatus Paceibacterota bacterium]|nr:histidine--tRNA ligase [Candidatus Paceibacterota bacterium]
MMPINNHKEPVKKVPISPKQGGKEGKLQPFQSPKGMHDILPADWPLWDKVYKAAKDVADFYNFSRIETPMLESVDLFVRGVGEVTDIVEKEMFVLKTKGGDKLALRPEFTSPVVRSYIENGLHRLPQPLKLYYWGPVFRHEKPQAGRYRQFNQLGFEILGGEGDPIYDSQAIILAYRFLEELKAKNLMVQVNSIGCRVCRPNYKKKLIEYYKKQDICKECEGRLEKNPLRLLDCKSDVCQPVKLGAPSILDSLCAACKKHFKEALEYLDEVSIPYTLNPYLVRGLDYYNRTVFEIFREGSDLAIASGGRYDYLSEMLGGRPTPATGVAAGLERVVEMLKADLKDQNHKVKSKVFLVHVGEMTKKRALLLVEEFRKANMPVMEALGKDSLSAQLERAAKMNSPFALILGQKEAYEGSIILRDMTTGVQESIPLNKIIEEVKRRQ